MKVIGTTSEARPGLLMAFALALFACMAMAPRVASADGAPIDWDVTGAFWDAAFTGGAGVGFGARLPTPVLAQLRLGGGYAHEPWFLGLGVMTGLGGLGNLTLGAAAELGHFDGAFLELAGGYSRHQRALLQATVGYTVFGVTYQHLLRARSPGHALLVVLRVPVGFWWFMVGHDESRAGQVQAARTASEPPSAEGPSALARKRAERARLQGDEARAGQDLLAAEAAYAEAVALVDDPQTRIALADIRVALGKLVAAAADLRAALEVARAMWQDARVQVLSERYLAVFGRLAQLRVAIPEVREGLVVEVDGMPIDALLLGYDHALDPGKHFVAIKRSGRVVLERRFQAAEGEIIRLSAPQN